MLGHWFVPALILVVSGVYFIEIGQQCNDEHCDEGKDNKYKIEHETLPDKDTESTIHEKQLTPSAKRHTEQKISYKPYSYEATAINEVENQQREATNSDEKQFVHREVDGEQADEFRKDKTIETAEKEAYEFPPLSRLDAGQVGEVKELELERGVVYRRITRAVKPLVFEIPNFLSSDESQYIINKANEVGLETSALFGAEIREQLEMGANLSDIPRISQTTWVRAEHLGPTFRTKLHARLAKLTDLPVGVIERAEPLQVVHYGPGGHYHAHLDSVENPTLPCCFQTYCGNKEKTKHWGECCRLCRFVTVMYYLNDVEEGGETAFPLADMPDKIYKTLL